MNKEAKKRKQARYDAKIAPFTPCPCGSREIESEEWKGRQILRCTKCTRVVFADTRWEVSVGWHLGLEGDVTGKVKPWNEIEKTS